MFLSKTKCLSLADLKLRPCDRSRCAEHVGKSCTVVIQRCCARPTGGSRGRTTDAPAHGRGGRKAKAALVEDCPVPQYNAANNITIIKAGAPKSPGPMIPTPTSLRQSPRSTQRLTTPTDGTPPLARSIALCPHG